MNRVVDPGLPLERTVLAWRRTCLAIAIGAVALARFGAVDAGPIVVVLSMLGFALAGIAYVGTTRRYGRQHRALASGRGLPSDGWPFLALAASVVLVGSACLVVVT